MASCPSCGRNVVDDATFCGYCGTRVAAEPYSPAPTPQRSPREYWVCHSCQSENLVEDAFCQSCGVAKDSAAGPVTPVAAAAGAVGTAPPGVSAQATAAAGTFCSLCGAENEAGAHFCFACGAPLDDPAAVAGGPAAGPTAGRSSRWVILAVVVVAIAAVAVAAIILFGGDGGSSGSGSGSGGDTASSGNGTTSGGSGTTDSGDGSTPTTVTPTVENVTGYASARATSCLNAAQGNQYRAQNLLDGAMRTCWAEGVSGYGIGETITFKFSQRMTLTRMDVVPGYKKYDYSAGVDRWRSNGRLRSVTVTFADGTSQSYPFSDSKSWQSCVFPSDEIGSVVRMTIDSVYFADSGTRHDAEDTSVSEVRFYGWPASEGGE